MYSDLCTFLPSSTNKKSNKRRNHVRIESGCAVEIYSPDTLGFFTMISYVTRVPLSSTTRAPELRHSVTSHRPRPRHSTSDLSSRTRLGGGRFTRPTLSTSPFFRARVKSLLPLPPLSRLPIFLIPSSSSSESSERKRRTSETRSRRSDGANRSDQLRTPSRASSASSRCVGVMVSATGRKAGVRIFPLSPLL